jgi:hypothetical protein
VRRMKNQFDIVIIGGGLVGLSTILSLKEVILNKPNFKVALIEKGNFSKLNTLDYDGRTSFIGLGSKAILEEFAVFKEIEPLACKVEKIFAYEEDGSKSKDSLYFSTLFEEKMEMGYIVHNSDLRQKLYEAVKKLDITILENTGVVDFETSDKVVIELDNKTETATLDVPYSQVIKLNENMNEKRQYMRHPYTDVYALKTKFDFSCINFSIGYYDYHTKNEYVVVEDTFNGIEMGKKMIELLGYTKYHKTIEKSESFRYW